MVWLEARRNRIPINTRYGKIRFPLGVSVGSVLVSYQPSCTMTPIAGLRNSKVRYCKVGEVIRESSILSDGMSSLVGSLMRF